MNEVYISLFLSFFTFKGFFYTIGAKKKIILKAFST